MSTVSISDRIQEVGRLYKTGLSTRDIAPLIGISKSTAALYLSKSGVPSECVERIRAKAIGRPSARKGVVLSDATKAKMSAAMKGHTMNVGSKRTPEQCANMSRAAQRRVLDPQDRIKRSETSKKAALGRKLSPEEKAARDGTRAACKRMLKRILTMSRVRKDATTEALLGYSQTELRAHLEAQFRTGMSWDARESFDIDHKRPVADFFRNGIYDPRQINALDNLQVLTPAENRAKSDHYVTISARGTEAGIQRA